MMCREKRAIGVFAIAIVALLLVTASAMGASKYKGISLSFFCNFAGVPGEEMQKVIRQFETDTGATVEYSAPGANYEEIMKTKMATKDLPDLWTTHGWSYARYGEYLRPLNDQPWIKSLSPAAKSIVTDPRNGKIYTLPIDVDVTGLVFNKTILQACNIKVDDLKTWAQFTIACQKIKDRGYIPIHVAGKERWPVGHFFNRTAPSFYITNETKNYRKEFKNGTFDWNRWIDVCNLMDSYVKKGFFNVDCLTADYNTAVKAVAANKVAFAGYGNFLITEALKTNPNVKLSMMPMPAKDSTDEPSLIGGELATCAVWKDTKHMDAAIELLNYFAKPANMSAIASAEGVPAGFIGVASDMGAIKDDVNKYMKNYRTFPFFDREYLPNGMWDDLCTSGALILAQEGDAVKNAIKLMSDSYSLKFLQ
jgi:raffinose/stachyose/melibiose transport system substrate-binding protein